MPHGRGPFRGLPLGWDLRDRVVRQGSILMAAKDYQRVTVRDHPLADSNGKSYAHRVALYDAIGPGPHVCHWCGWDGLRWDVDRDDPNYLIPDHLNGNGRDNDPANLVPSHSWCNNNRATIEGKDLSRPLGWDMFKDKAPGDREALYNHRLKAPTPRAIALAGECSPRPAVEGAGPPPSPLPSEPTPRHLLPIRSGLRRWEDLTR